MSITGGAISLVPDMPESVMIPEKNYTSTSDAVLSRRHIELAPINDGQPFLSTQNNEIIFQIASTTSFWDLEHFYITGELTLGRVNGAVDATDLHYKLNRVGLSSIIESVEIRSASTGTVFDRLDQYNLFCAMEDNLFMTPEALERNFCSEFKCSTDEDYGTHFSTLFTNNANHLVGTRAGNANHYVDTVTNDPVGASSIRDAIPPQSLVFGGALSGATVTSGVFMSCTRPSTLADLNIHGVTGAAGTAAAAFQVTPRIIMSRSDSAMNIGRAICRDAGTVWPFALKLRNGFFRQKNDFPLYLFPRGIQIAIRLDPLAFHRAFHCMSPLAVYNDALGAIRTIANVATFTPALSNVKAQCIFRNMHSSISNQYLDLYTSGKGFLIPFTSYKWFQKILGSAVSTENIEISAGVRSARHVMARLIPNSWWVGDGTIIHGRVMDILNCAMRLGLNSFQFKTGSLDFPIRPVYVNEAAPANTKRHQMITGNLEREQVNTSFRYEATPYLASNSDLIFGSQYQLQPHYPMGWAAGKGFYRVDGFSTGLYMVQALYRDEGYFAGTDVSMQPLRIELNFTDTPEHIVVQGGPAIAASMPELVGQNRLFQCFVAHDSYLHISEGGGIVRLT